MHQDDVVTINRYPRETVSFSTIGEIFDTCLTMGRYRFGPKIILANIDNRQFVDPRIIYSLMPAAAGGCTLAEKGNDNIILLLDLESRRLLSARQESMRG